MTQQSAFAYPVVTPARTNRVIIHVSDEGLVFWRSPRGKALHPAGHLQDLLDEDGIRALEDAARKYYAGLTRR